MFPTYRLMIAAMVVATPSGTPVPQWVADIASTNPNPSYWGQIQFAVSKANDLLRSGWQGQQMHITGLPSIVSLRAAAAGLVSKSRQPDSPLWQCCVVFHCVAFCCVAFIQSHLFSSCRAQGKSPGTWISCTCLAGRTPQGEQCGACRFARSLSTSLTMSPRTSRPVLACFGVQYFASESRVGAMCILAWIARASLGFPGTRAVGLTTSLVMKQTSTSSLEM